MSGPSALSHEAKLIPINSVKPYRGNARVGNMDVIRESLRRNNQYRPIVVRTQTKEVLAGNHTWLAAKQEGWTEIWATFIEVDAQTAKRINLVDNRAPELGGYDEEALLSLLQSTSELEGTGWTGPDVDRLSSQLIAQVGGDTEPSELPTAPKTKRGDLLLLGEHRLLCGDATVEDEMERLLGGEFADCLWTDPPYIGPGDNSQDHPNARKKSASQSVNSLQELLTKSFTLCDQSLREGAVVYVCHPGGPHGALFTACFTAQPWRIRQTLVWLKESMYVFGHDYHMQHEQILEGEKYEAELIAYGFAKKLPSPKDRWFGNRHQSSVLEFARAKGESFHSTMKPVGLVEQMLANSTRRDWLVLDPFCGSGTSILACENLGRRCCAMEIDPGYCDVIVDRWERHTGDEAKKAPKTKAS